MSYVERAELRGAVTRPIECGSHDASDDSLERKGIGDRGAFPNQVLHDPVRPTGRAEETILIGRLLGQFRNFF
jgi:hypothetical protein